MKPQIRRIVIQIEEIHNEIGKMIDPPARKATCECFSLAKC